MSRIEDVVWMQNTYFFFMLWKTLLCFVSRKNLFTAVFSTGHYYPLLPTCFLLITVSGANTSSLTPRYFILNGIPGLEAAHIWISLPFCFMYLTAVTGNCGLIYLIIHEEALHRPMYYFLAMLSATDISGCNKIVPSMLCIFWFSLKEIDFNACLAQMFFIHMLTGMESGVLMLMALDCYVAICYPLRYFTILTNTDYQGWIGDLHSTHDPLYFPDQVSSIL